MCLKKLIKVFIGLFFIIFFTSCTILSNESSNGITIYESDCKEIIGLGCKKEKTLKGNMKNTSIYKGVNKNNKASKNTIIKSKPDTIYNLRAEEHCKKFKKKARLVQINERDPMIDFSGSTYSKNQQYHEIYKCI